MKRVCVSVEKREWEKILRVIRSSFCWFYFILSGRIWHSFSCASLYFHTNFVCEIVCVTLRFYFYSQWHKRRKNEFIFACCPKRIAFTAIASSSSLQCFEKEKQHIKALPRNDPHPIQITISAAIYLVSIEDDSIFSLDVATPYLTIGRSASKTRAFSYSISFHVLCFPLLILSSILHIVDIVIDVFAATATACYSNFKRWVCARERCSSIFIGKTEYLYFFFSWIFLVHALPCHICCLRHRQYTHTHSHQYKNKTKRRQSQCA